MIIKLQLDPWPADYEPGIQMETPGEEPSRDVDPTVEIANWREIHPSVEIPDREICFVDGVRRVEARVLADADNQLVHGLFGSTAVGCVRSGNEAAAFGEIEVRRFLILGCGLERSELIRIGECDLRFEAFSTPLNSPDEVLSELQNLMRTSEASLGESLISPGAHVFVDGPLTYFSTAKQEIIGVVKSIHLPYLPAAHFSLVPELATGSRTPLFAILDGKHDRYSWFLRVAEGRRIDHPLAGVLRLEVRSAIGVDRAKELADFSALHLPPFASTPAREPRAPQNLTPVGALEEELRRRMGDALILRRSIEKRLWVE